jgi:hypothetical protein
MTFIDYLKSMKTNGIFYLVLTTIVLVALTIMVFLNVPFSVIFYVTVGGQLLLLFTVYKVLTDDFSTKKTFDDWYEDHPIGKEER